MRYRCTNPRSKYYPHYGGRGITVCDRWNEFERFLEDMGTKPEKLSLDRIDNDKGYFKENCRWADQQTQNENSSRMRLVTYQGKTQNIKSWARELNINYQTLYGRMHRYGKSFEQSIL